MNNKIALHAHNFGHKNIGDEAMAQNVFNKLKKHGYDVYTITTYEPPLGQSKEFDRISLSGIVNNYNNIIIKIFLVTVNRLKLKTFYAVYVKVILSLIMGLARLHKLNINLSFVFPRLYKLFDAFKSADIYVRSGSGSLNDIWFWSSLMPQYAEARLAKLFNTKVYFTGQGIGPITGSYRGKIMKEFVSCVDLFTLRDKTESESFLNSLGCRETAKYASLGDDALDLPTEVKSSFPLIDGDYIVCQFRSTDYQNKINEKCWKNIADEVDKISSEYPHLKFCFISFSNGIVNDLDIAKKISSLCTTGVYIQEEILTPEQAKWIIGNAVIAIGQSYHFGVFALSENVPFFGLYTNEYYKLKHTGLLEWYGMEEYVVSMNDNMEFLPRLKSYLDNKDMIQEKMNEINVDKKNNINRVFETL